LRPGVPTELGQVPGLALFMPVNLRLPGAIVSVRRLKILWVTMLPGACSL
jgi:hypothetical protein